MGNYSLTAGAILLTAILAPLWILRRHEENVRAQAKAALDSILNQAQKNDWREVFTPEIESMKTVDIETRHSQSVIELQGQVKTEPVVALTAAQRWLEEVGFKVRQGGGDCIETRIPDAVITPGEPLGVLKQIRLSIEDGEAKVKAIMRAPWGAVVVVLLCAFLFLTLTMLFGGAASTQTLHDSEMRPVETIVYFGPESIDNHSWVYALLWLALVGFCVLCSKFEDRRTRMARASERLRELLNRLSRLRPDPQSTLY